MAGPKPVEASGQSQALAMFDPAFFIGVSPDCLIIFVT
jgi:hypothetical protein